MTGESNFRGKIPCSGPRAKSINAREKKRMGNEELNWRGLRRYLVGMESEREEGNSMGGRRGL